MGSEYPPFVVFVLGFTNDDAVMSEAVSVQCVEIEPSSKSFKHSAVVTYINMLLASPIDINCFVHYRAATITFQFQMEFTTSQERRFIFSMDVTFITLFRVVNHLTDFIGDYMRVGTDYRFDSATFKMPFR